MSSSQHTHSSSPSSTSPGPDARSSRRTDQRIIALASGQHGVVTRSQLLGEGLSCRVVDGRVRSGLLQQVYRGVYRVGPAESPKAREMAAALVCGESAIVSGRSSAVLWRMLRSLGVDDPIEVTVAGRRPVARPGIVVRHVRVLVAEEITQLDGIPIATPARTLFDLAGGRRPRDVESALSEALVLRLVERREIVALLDRHAGQPGARRLRELLESESTAGVTRSEAEEQFLRLIRSAQLREPLTNAKCAGYEVDFLWHRERLVVEVDGHSYHSSRRRFESDRRRDAALVAHGIRVMRVTWQQITKESHSVVARVALALGVIQ
jgi:very-short-patch-repair endonuclease